MGSATWGVRKTGWADSAVTVHIALPAFSLLFAKYS